MTVHDPRDFKVLAFFPADHAVTENGKLYVNGGSWSQIQFPSFPHVINAASLVAILEVPFTALNAEHELQIAMEDQDGVPLAVRAQIKFRVGSGASLDYGDPSVMPLALPIPNLLIPKPGSYTFTLSVDGKEAARFWFKALQMALPIQFAVTGPESGGPAPEAPPD
jgi:hypothetical protein